MPVQPGPSGDEAGGVGVLFISCQLMCTALSSVPVITHNAAPRLDADNVHTSFLITTIKRRVNDNYENSCVC